MPTQNSKVKTQNHNSKLKTDIKLRCFAFSLNIIKYVAIFPNQKLYWIISDQLLRSATSIGANIVEAKASSSKREFIKYYEIALKSANETLYWLCLIRDSEDLKVDKQIVKILLQEAVEISKILGSSLLTMKNKNKF